MIVRWTGCIKKECAKMGTYNFHRDCIHYNSVTKEPRPEGKHKSRLHIKCNDIEGNGGFYYCDSDFENIKTGCIYFEPKEPTIFDYIKS